MKERMAWKGVIVKFRMYDHANQNTNGGVKLWHHTHTKARVEIDKYVINGSTIIWLLTRIGMLEDHYYDMLCLKFQG